MSTSIFSVITYARKSTHLLAFHRVWRLQIEPVSGASAKDTTPPVSRLAVSLFKKYEDALHLNLRRSGSRTKPTSYLSIKATMTLGVALSGLMLLKKIPMATWWLVLGSVGTYFIPDLFLINKIRQRQNQIMKTLPDFIDILAVCADSGLNIETAIQTATPTIKGPLKEEMSLVIDLMSAGKSSIDALRSLINVCDTPQMISFVSSIAQARELGTPISEILYDQSNVARQIMKQSIEAKVGTIPTRVSLYTVIFLFPPIFVLLVLPSLLTFISQQ